MNPLILNFLRENPSWLKASYKRLISRLEELVGDAIGESIAREAVKQVRRELKEGNHSISDNHAEGVSAPEELLVAECNRLGIDRSKVKSTKYWRGQKGQDFLSIVTDDKVEEMEDRDAWKADLLADIRKESKPIENFNINLGADSGNMAVFQMPDIHLGKVAPNWTLEEACDTTRSIFSELRAFAQLHDPTKNLIPLGHDLLQIDSEHLSRSGTLHTTSGGTPVERTNPWTQLFKRARRLGKDLLEDAASSKTARETEAIIVPGNHSGRSEVALGEVWDAEFSRDDRINIVNTGDFHTPVKWGTTGILLSHGDTVPWDKLPLLFATMEPELWGSTKYREVHCGHNHISAARPVGFHMELQSVICRICPSLSPQDDWHKKFGYYSIPAAEVYIYNKERGLIAKYDRKIL
jgi:hypothetical protein